jgi:hypothetical protein
LMASCCGIETLHSALNSAPLHCFTIVIKQVNTASRQCYDCFGDIRLRYLNCSQLKDDHSTYAKLGTKPPYFQVLNLEPQCKTAS